MEMVTERTFTTSTESKWQFEDIYFVDRIIGIPCFEIRRHW